jgi:hypothetical protein
MTLLFLMPAIHMVIRSVIGHSLDDAKGVARYRRTQNEHPESLCSLLHHEPGCVRTSLLARLI